MDHREMKTRFSAATQAIGYGGKSHKNSSKKKTEQILAGGHICMASN